MLLFYIFFFCTGYVSASLLTDVRSQKSDQGSIMSCLKSVNESLGKLLTNQEHLVNLAISRTISVMSSDIADLKRQTTVLEEENIALKKQEVELQKHLREMNASITKLQKEQGGLNDQLQELQSDTSTIITDLQQQMTNISRQIDDYTTNAQDQAHSLKLFQSNITSHIANLQQQTTNISRQFDYSTKKVQDQVHSLELIQSNITSQIANLSETVAFAAFISKTLEVHRNTQLNVVFDQVDFNAGNGYNAQDGFFTAPLDGLFVFTWAFLVEPKKLFDSYIQVNGKNTGLSNCNNELGNGILPCSNTTPLLLKKGDKVNIRKATGNKIYGDKLCSFKGWKVY